MLAPMTHCEANIWIHCAGGTNMTLPKEEQKDAST